MIGTRRGCLRAGLTLFIVCLGLLLVSTDRRILLLARNTLWLSLGVCIVSLPVGTVLGFFLSRTDIPLRRTTWWLLAALLFVPLYLQAAAWDAGFGKLGWYAASGGSLDAPPLSGWFAAIGVHALWSVAWVTLIVAVALRLSEPELEEQALLDAPAWRVFCSVTLRRALPGVVVAGIWVALMTAGEMTVTDLYQIRTLAEELYTGFAMSTGEEMTFGFSGRGVADRDVNRNSLDCAGRVHCSGRARSNSWAVLFRTWALAMAGGRAGFNDPGCPDGRATGQLDLSNGHGGAAHRWTACAVLVDQSLYRTADPITRQVPGQRVMAVFGLTALDAVDRRLCRHVVRVNSRLAGLVGTLRKLAGRTGGGGCVVGTGYHGTAGWTGINLGFYAQRSPVARVGIRSHNHGTRSGCDHPCDTTADADLPCGIRHPKSRRDGRRHARWCRARARLMRVAHRNGWPYWGWPGWWHSPHRAGNSRRRFSWCPRG